ncbi:MAG: GGDEF domain-containing protein [Treponema sp.]|nr:GGDEF domain-containing protein [Treponema sp.]
MKKVFKNNLHGLYLINIIAAVCIACFSVFPIVVEHNKFKAFIYIIAAVIALLLFVFSNYKYKQLRHGKYPGNHVIYLLMIIFFINIMLFGIYVGVWSNPNGLAVIFMSLLICALFLYINPPPLNLCLSVGAFLFFSVSSILFKTPQLWIFDIMHAFIALMLGLILGWHNAMMRMRSALNASDLENERDSFYALSTIDELSQLKNRRDFMQTFERFLVNYRQSDNFLYIAIMDIDFFKNYNDHYGHPKGDECLRSIGRMLNDLQNSMGVYAARVGGEEFAMLWFGEGSSQADVITAFINRKLYELNIPHEKSNVAPYITVSIGVHILKCGASHDIHALYDLADKALYAAKKKGRNCTVVNSS